jgi:hypothetical protein
MLTYLVTIAKSPSNPGYQPGGRLVETIEINARDPYSARSLVEAQYSSGGYRVQQVTVKAGRPAGWSS